MDATQSYDEQFVVSSTANWTLWIILFFLAESRQRRG